MNEFIDQTAVITGAASGIGLAIAQKLLEEGANVALLDIDKVALNREFEESENCTLIPLDITNIFQVNKAVEKTVGKYGGIEILVNCAGITGVTNGLSHNVDINDLRKVFELNFMSIVYTSKYVIPYMLKQSYGRILHLASIAGKEGNAGMLAYSASKAAVIGMTKVQGKEYAETGITVNALAPAVIRTPLVEVMPDEQVKYMTDKIPMKRCGTLDEVANEALFIISPKNSFTTGFTFDLSGGRATY